MGLKTFPQGFFTTYFAFWTNERHTRGIKESAMFCTNAKRSDFVDNPLLFALIVLLSKTSENELMRIISNNYPR